MEATHDHVIMGRAYPEWFRWRIIFADGTAAQVADRFGVSRATVFRLRNRFAASGNVTRALPSGGRPSVLNEQAMELLREMILRRPDVSVQEARQMLQHARASASAIPRTFNRLDFTLYKPRVQRQEDHRVNFWASPPSGPRGTAGIAGVPPLSVIDIDTLSITFEHDRRTDRSAPGERDPRSDVHTRARVKWNVILAIDMNRGPVAFWILRDDITSDIFSHFIRHMLIPELKLPYGFRFPRTILCDALWDYLSQDRIVEIGTAGHRILARPAHSPDMAPIESAFDKIKQVLMRQRDDLSEGNLLGSIRSAILSITKEECREWFLNCHYDVPGLVRRPYMGANAL